MKTACNYQNFNRGRLVAAWIWNVVSARPDGLERGRRTSVNPAALYRRAAALGLDSGFINRTARHYFPDLDLRTNVWKIPRQPEFRLFEKEADGELGRAFNDWAYFLFAKEGRVPVSTFNDYAKQTGVDFRTLRQTARALRLDTIQGDFVSKGKNAGLRFAVDLGKERLSFRIAAQGDALKSVVLPPPASRRRKRKNGVFSPPTRKNRHFRVNFNENGGFALFSPSLNSRNETGSNQCPTLFRETALSRINVCLTQNNSDISKKADASLANNGYRWLRRSTDAVSRPRRLQRERSNRLADWAVSGDSTNLRQLVRFPANRRSLFPRFALRKRLASESSDQRRFRSRRLFGDRVVEETA